MNTEYNATTTSSRSCYSNINSYGTDGKVHQIIPPMPATLQPTMFNVLKPHSLTQEVIPPEKQNNCAPYRTLLQICYN